MKESIGFALIFLNGSRHETDTSVISSNCHKFLSDMSSEKYQYFFMLGFLENLKKKKCPMAKAAEGSLVVTILTLSICQHHYLSQSYDDRYHS